MQCADFTNLFVDLIHHRPAFAVISGAEVHLQQMPQQFDLPSCIGGDLQVISAGQNGAEQVQLRLIVLLPFQHQIGHRAKLIVDFGKLRGADNVCDVVGLEQIGAGLRIILLQIGVVPCHRQIVVPHQLGIGLGVFVNLLPDLFQDCPDLLFLPGATADQDKGLQPIALTQKNAGISGIGNGQPVDGLIY